MGTTAQKLKKVLENKQLIVNSVNTKAGTSFDINSKISDIVDAIENIEAGSSGSCEPTGEPLVVEKLPDAPTAIPHEGYVENIYLNSELSFEEIYNILSSLTYTDLSSYGLTVPTYIVFASTDTETACLIQGGVDGDVSGYAISVIPDFFNVMNSGGNLSDYMFLSVMKDNTGIQGIFSPNIENPNYHGTYYALNDNVLNSFGELSIGTENEKVKNLLSVTPFNKDINPNAIYALVQNNAEVWVLGDGGLVNIGELAKEEGATFEIYFVKDIPLAENMLPSSEFEVYIYWVETENEGYLLMDGQVVKYSETFGIELPINGVVTSLDEIKDAGLHLLKLSDTKYYKYDNGWVELNAENGKIEIYEVGAPLIPTFGYIQYVIANSSKTIDERIEILSTLSISDGETYVVLANADGSKRLTINKNNGVYSISDEKSELWNSNTSDDSIAGLFLIYSFTDDASPTTVIDGVDYQVGTKNEKLVTLFTTKLDETMFTGGKLKLYELKENLVAEKEILFKNGTYDLSKYLDENKIPFKISVDLPYATLKDYGYRGTPIVTNPIIDKVYLNINMTPDEINDYLSTIEIHKLAPGTGRETYATIFSTENFSLSVDSSSDSKSERIKIKIHGSANGVSTTYFEYHYNTKTGGWKDGFDGIINVNEPPIQNLLNIGSKNQPAGLEYTRLISGTPFVSGQELDGEYDTTPVSVDINESSEIDIAELVNKQKIPSKLMVNVASSGSGTDMLQTRVDSDNSCKYLFYNYSGTNIDFISGLDTSSVTDMSNMFTNCKALTSVPQLNTSSVTNMYYMFYGCSKLQTLPQLDTSNVTDMSYMFQNCSSLTSVPQLNTINVTVMTNMFQNSGIKTISLLNTSKVTDMSQMFASCSGLEIVEKLDTSNCINMRALFLNCHSLTSIPQLNTSKATNMSNIFQTCSKLTSVSQLDTSSATDMSKIFTECKLLKTIDITYYNISSTSYSSRFAYYCTALKSLIIRQFGSSYALNTDSLQNSGIANGTGYIYVPRAMVDTLKSATNWSTYASQIRALEDYTIDGTTTGALDETKI